MLEAWINLVQDFDPDMIVGYNSSRFDIPYLVIRATKWDQSYVLGRIKGESWVSSFPCFLLTGLTGNACKIKEIPRTWSYVPNIAGRIQFDMQNYITKFESSTEKHGNKLGAVAKRFLGDESQKGTLDFKLTNSFQETEEGRTKIAKYCLQVLMIPVSSLYFSHNADTGCAYSSRAHGQQRCA